MDDVASAQSENENLRKIRNRLMQWESKTDPLAALSAQQEEHLDVLTNLWHDDETTLTLPATPTNVTKPTEDNNEAVVDIKLPAGGLQNTNDFLLWFVNVNTEIEQRGDANYQKYLQQLEQRKADCAHMLTQISVAMDRLGALSAEYEFVSQKTSSLNTASEQLIDEQHKLQALSNEIQHRLHYFSQVELLNQRLQSPTLSVASEAFRECLSKIDECLNYLAEHPNFKDAAAYNVKYKQCLSKATSLVRNYVVNIINQATEATLHPRHGTTADASLQAPDAAFALYYGKYQTSAAKVKRVAQLVESRLEQSSSNEYGQLMTDLQQHYLAQRASVMSSAVNQSILNVKNAHKGDHCSLTRSACAFLVHVCQDEQRLYYQFFGTGAAHLTVYLEGLCTILYDTMRPFIIHINHLETLAEICSILRIEMLEEHVQQNPSGLEAFAIIAHQLLQDVQERLVFRAHLYLQSDIQNYNPSTGDLAYPEKLEMMESIALSLQEPVQLRRSDSRASVTSNETESVDTSYRVKQMNSPADLHGMWYPTVRRTLVCLSRLYRCVDLPIFQGLSQEALKLCIQSVSQAAIKISAAKTPIDGELFEIKHLLILREQIAPFRVDFTIKETSLDFSKVKTAAFGLLQKRKQLFSMGSNNALLEFLLEGTPQIKEHLLDSRKEVDRQLKTVCEQYIKDAVHMLAGPLVTFLDKAQTLLLANDTASKATTPAAASAPPGKINYVLRQSSWASPQQISSIIQETQRLIKAKLAVLQRAMQLYLSNRDTEFIIFRPIRNNIIQSFVKLEQLLTTNGYSADDMIITSCPSAEQVSILLSSASILAAEGVASFAAAARKISTSSSVDGATATSARKHSSVSFSKAEAAQAVVLEEPEIEHPAETAVTDENKSDPAQQPQSVEQPDGEQANTTVDSAGILKNSPVVLIATQQQPPQISSE
ncbi:conserved oligomeric Golgi complex subunit 3 [Drosophila grimshawi]|uniref:Conserved oligomeric Golgi complex subunit 3 n=1 Tax=Drosophila grimshawi TaxID=7222 RepID=B4JBU6_DROGR|nr:conserved oligomeric Golgi complex subunit 3 [Drosophila grimshawi]EDW04049.1 GH10190 [Drosophila grimshawi]